MGFIFVDFEKLHFETYINNPKIYLEQRWYAIDIWIFPVYQRMALLFTLLTGIPINSNVTRSSLIQNVIVQYYTCYFSLTIVVKRSSKLSDLLDKSPNFLKILQGGKVEKWVYVKKYSHERFYDSCWNKVE